MFKKVIRTIFGDPMERAVNKYREIVTKINALESAMRALPDDEGLLAKSNELKARLQKGETLDDLLPEAFALVRETSRRKTGLRHYDVQLIGGMVLHQGRIAEMKTGEGKTLVATLPMYLNALTGKGVHLVTPNDYLSKFGLQQMGIIYHTLGLSASVIQNTGGSPDDGSYLFNPAYQSDDARFQNLEKCTRRQAYRADITYGTNNEFGFDYLRDNMVWKENDLTQRPLYYAIVDEVDNILIDEARTPLIISGQADEPSEYYKQFSDLVKQLKPSTPDSVEAKEPDEDYVVDEKDRLAYLTEQGVERVESLARSRGILKADHLYHPDNVEMIPYLDNCLRAKALYHRDHEYVVQDGKDGKEIVIVDDFTGRLMPGRRFSEGLHQAIEAKEGVQVRRENVTMATITFQNFFRMYEKLGGMTGTALTEQEEFEKIYNLEVIAIPTNVKVTRLDRDDLVYQTEKGKWHAVVQEIKERNAKGQPVLVGTVAIETSERLSKELERARIEHSVLNAKKHESEAIVIAQAGRKGAVTIATNMAGRGVDILLGGNPEGITRELLRQQGKDITTATPEELQHAKSEAQTICKREREEVLQAGGLFVIGTERHEARRIDNQLRGRSGRQGDPGESRFYLSLEDDLMRRFNSEQVKKVLGWINLPEDEPIEHGMISKTIEQAQVRVEGYNFDIRKRVIEYDDVVNLQRSVFYKQRREWLTKPNDVVRKDYFTLLEKAVLGTVNNFAEGENVSDWDVELLHKELLIVFPVPVDITPDTMQTMTRKALETALLDGLKTQFELKETQFNTLQPDWFFEILRTRMLYAMDSHWQRHLTALDVLREGIGLVSIGQRDPLVEYKRESFVMFEAMQAQISEVACNLIWRVNPQVVERQPARPVRNLQTNAPKEKNEPVRKDKKLGRNDPCHCGSGKKYKDCHMRVDQKVTQ